MKHIGKLRSGDKVVVAMMQIPQNPERALVIRTDRLETPLQKFVMDLLQSQEGQAERDFADMMNRRMMPQTNQTVLAAMHKNGLLEGVDVADVLMTPRPNMAFPLTDILRGMAAQPGSTTIAPPPEDMTQRYNPHIVNQEANQTEQSQAIARNRIAQAELLEADARRMREEAYAMAPALRPVASPQVVELDEFVVTQDEPEVLRSAEG